MAFDRPQGQKRHIAIIGAGVSGLGAAYHLSRSHRVTLIESAPRLGGHARTVMAGRNGDQPVDTGFIVFNYVNYPELTAMFAELDVPVKKSDMSFSASIDGGRVEYGTTAWNAVFAQRTNLGRAGFWRMLRDILHFNKHALATAQRPDMTVGDLLDTLGLGDWFRRYYFLPITGAIWSTSPDQMLKFPARPLVQFFDNHNLLGVYGQHEWWTVDGGSIEYVRRIARAIEAQGAEIRTGAPVAGVRRDEAGVEVRTQGGVWERFDDVVFACHSDDALAMLEAPTPEERTLLGAMRYQDNKAYLHADARVMPRRRACWASWVYKAPATHSDKPIGISYWMNKLQSIREDDPLFVSLNPAEEIDSSMIYDEATFRHPVFDSAAMAAQQEMPNLQGLNRTWYCGAYLRNGFHEDGYASAVEVARQMDAQKVWS
ncbi:NAD(P)/FAD-dependent oxidoreductase [Oceanomicrobium pacificus]|uniref:FAD-dependent oxidoreductase n=1 Tax=Oceanomicrobium pacificus TaxID=2692916 RepID=A0A6B0TY49_9RHOB|nr:FAD-dependent oxidoreductase [Oceanomicrobium pacificus]MXU66212.1 FAD-dependent oxidoreductase [Oceanomicrobium pacificus]